MNILRKCVFFEVFYLNFYLNLFLKFFTDFLPKELEDWTKSNGSFDKICLNMSGGSVSGKKILKNWFLKYFLDFEQNVPWLLLIILFFDRIFKSDFYLSKRSNWGSTFLWKTLEATIFFGLTGKSQTSCKNCSTDLLKLQSKLLKLQENFIIA